MNMQVEKAQGRPLKGIDRNKVIAQSLRQFARLPGLPDTKKGVRSYQSHVKSDPWLPLLFVVCFVLPTLAAGIYYGLIASDRYVSEARIVWNGIYLGLGLGFVFPPLTTLAFATIPGRLRTEGAAINALLRNLGASVGIALLVSLLDRNTQANRSAISEFMTVLSPFWRFGTTPMEHGIPVDRSRLMSYMTPMGGGFPYGAVPSDDPAKVIAMWGEEMVRQASMIASRVADGFA